MATKTRTKDLKKLWTDALSGKMPKDERDFLVEPKFAYLYAKYIRKKRWDEQDETVFYSDLKCCYLYSIFMEDTPPEHLHNFFIAKNLENLDDQDRRWVDEYFDYLKKNDKKKKPKNKK